MEELHLPSELLDDLFFLDGDRRSAADKVGKEDGGDPLARLARQMARSFVHDDEAGVVKVRAALEQHRWNLQEREFSGPPWKHCPGKSAGPFLSLQQLQAARIFHLKQQQVVQQQLYAAWERQSRARAAANNEASRRARPSVLPSSGFVAPRMQQQQPHAGSQMGAVFLRNSGARKESVGTGVFLPRPVVSKDEPLKKSACSTVLIPARVVQALNLNMEELRAPETAGFAGRFVLKNDAFVGRRNLLETHSRAQPAAIRASMGTLPQEWTY